MRHIATFLLLAATAVHAQSPTTRPPAATFAVASVKPSAPSTGGIIMVTSGPRPGGQWLSQNAPLMLLLRDAYPDFSVPGLIVGGPDWITAQRFDINAKADGDPSRVVMIEM